MTGRATQPKRARRRLSAWGWSLRAAGSTIWEAIVNLVNHEGMEISGYVSFMAILRPFPLPDLRRRHRRLHRPGGGGRQVHQPRLPIRPAGGGQGTGPTISNIVTHPRGDLLTFGILFAIWSASSGVEALRLLLNRCYAVPETRSVYLLRLQSVLLVILSAIAVAILSFAIVLAPVIERLLAHFHIDVLVDPNAWFRMRYGAVIPTTMIVLIALHLFLPNRKGRLAEIWPGTLITAVLWITGAAGFSIDVDNLANYDVITAAWAASCSACCLFDIAAVIFGFGAEMNAAIMRRLSPIAPAAVGDMRHSLHPEQGNQAAVDSVPSR